MNEHRQRFKGYDVTFWKGGTAAEPSTADSCRIEGSPFVYESFALPAEQRRVDQMMRLLDHTFERGRRTAKREIREALGVPEPRL